MEEVEEEVDSLGRLDGLVSFDKMRRGALPVFGGGVGTGHGVGSVGLRFVRAGMVMVDDGFGGVWCVWSGWSCDGLKDNCHCPRIGRAKAAEQDQTSRW